MSATAAQANSYASRVNIIKKVKVGKSWRFAQLLEDGRGHIRWDHVVIDGEDQVHKEGAYYLDWYQDGRRKRESVGNTPSEVQDRARRKSLFLESERAGIDVKEPDQLDSRRLSAVSERFLDATKARKKIGTYRSYYKSITRFQHRCTRRYIHQITRDDLLDFMSHLANDLKLGNRTIHGHLMAVITMLRDSGVSGLLQRRDWPKYLTATRPIYESEELAKFFKACDESERILFTFFLASGFREQEVAYLTWPDIDFSNNVVRVKAKPQWGFTPKNYEEREVPIPENVMGTLKGWKSKASSTSELVFPSITGGREHHLLDICKEIAWDAGLNCGHCVTARKQNTCATGPHCTKWFLHKFRHTFATIHLRDGVDLRTVQAWMGHKDIASTMVYLKPAQGEEAQRRVNSGRISSWTD
jgi:integrase/recombinase XerD